MAGPGFFSPPQPPPGSSWRGCLQGLTGQHGLRTKEGFATFGIGCPGQPFSLDRVVLPSHLVFVPPGPSIGQAPIEARFPGDAPRQARASLAYSTASPGARARRSRITPPCQARGPPRSRALPRRALAVACSTASPGAWASTLTRVLPRRALAVKCSTALPGARASTFARPTAPRAYCRVFYRLARRAGVDVRAPYRVARLLSRILLDGAPEPGLYPVYPARKVWKLDARRKKPVLKIARTQLPLAPAYAITAHGSQGKTLPAALVDFNVDKRTDVTFGTVAASRVRSREDVLILRRRTIEREREGRAWAGGLSLAGRSSAGSTRAARRRAQRSCCSSCEARRWTGTRSGRRRRRPQLARNARRGRRSTISRTVSGSGSEPTGRPFASPAAQARAGRRR